jgi:hypothetical protein
MLLSLPQYGTLRFSVLAGWLRPAGVTNQQEQKEDKYRCEPLVY